MPLAARRALDRSGWKLSLAAWKNLTAAARARLLELGAAPHVDGAAVARVLADAEPRAATIEAIPEPPPGAPPPGVVSAFAEQGPLSVAVWSALSELDRYALIKVAGRDDGERRRAAYAEIVGYTRVSTHVRPGGGVQMVNVAAKAETRRRARAETRVRMNAAAFELLAANAVPKGDVLGTARLAGIMAAKRTSELIPLCHALALTHVAIDVELDATARAVRIVSSVETVGKTGVEMEALVAASHAALTIYDMLKGIDRGMEIGPTRLVSKSGGASGDFVADPEP